MKTIGLFVGSLRRESFNKKIANHLTGIAPKGYEFKIISLEKLEMYNQDFDDDGNPPASYIEFRKQLNELDGFIFITPEYNRSVPAVLKNAIDVGSRPYGKNSWDGKPGAIISSSLGNISGFGANHHLRQSLVFVNVLTLQQPEAYIASVNKLFDDTGKLTSESTSEFFQKFVDAFAKWVETTT
ncbi:NADPH-dependent FMN reductase [Sphingobacterium hungaricum]|uniref:NADPH-dependent FMN reductase n=1 Tax=Sphingobacterium hungaricum TaxID=2082723 RepID=A0A928YNW2_9SPHI|nr:NAD(P)H-dependent oxidoreductase [Sphingobacterium hungaricum]MBE8712481.1 NADPH-dependent FMN reductase [Sphingobacterium hungaricum]